MNGWMALVVSTLILRHLLAEMNFPYDDADPNFLIGDWFGLLLFFNRYESTYFRNGVRRKRPLSREVSGRRKRPNKRKKGRLSRVHGAPVLFVNSLFQPSAPPPSSASSIRQIPFAPPHSHRKPECQVKDSGRWPQSDVVEWCC